MHVARRKKDTTIFPIRMTNSKLTIRCSFIHLRIHLYWSEKFNHRSTFLHLRLHQVVQLFTLTRLHQPYKYYPSHSHTFSSHYQYSTVHGRHTRPDRKWRGNWFCGVIKEQRNRKSFSSAQGIGNGASRSLHHWKLAEPKLTENSVSRGNNARQVTQQSKNVEDWSVGYRVIPDCLRTPYEDTVARLPGQPMHITSQTNHEARESTREAQMFARTFILFFRCHKSECLRSERATTRAGFEGSKGMYWFNLAPVVLL